MAGGGGAGFSYVDCWTCECHNCRERSYWRGEVSVGRLIEPIIGGGPRAHPDMPEEVRKDYEEARTIVMQSPRGACALLRLAVQKLCKELGEPGENINVDIASFVQKGLSVDVQQALDTLRVIGNNAVHTGEMDLTDGTETASALFELLNFIVEDQISQPKKRAESSRSCPRKPSPRSKSATARNPSRADGRRKRPCPRGRDWASSGVHGDERIAELFGRSRVLRCAGQARHPRVRPRSGARQPGASTAAGRRTRRRAP